MVVVKVVEEVGGEGEGEHSFHFIIPFSIHQ
jgi:hypothetical protein